MTIAAIQHHLSTPEGFAKAVGAKRPLYTAGITLLLLGLGGVAMNLFQLGTASDWDWNLMTRFFFDAQAIEFTGRRSGRAEMWRYVYVYGPILLVPLGVVLLAVHFATRAKRGAGLYTDFRERGWVGRQIPVGLRVQNGNAQVPVAFVSHPSVPDEVFATTAHRYSSYVDTLDKKARKAEVRKATKAGVLNGISASVLIFDAPPPIVASVLQPKSEFVIVVPPAPGSSTKMQVLPIKS